MQFKYEGTELKVKGMKVYVMQMLIFRSQCGYINQSRFKDKEVCQR